MPAATPAPSGSNTTSRGAGGEASPTLLPIGARVRVTESRILYFLDVKATLIDHLVDGQVLVEWEAEGDAVRMSFGPEQVTRLT